MGCTGGENLFFLMMCTLFMFYDFKVQCDRITKFYAQIQMVLEILYDNRKHEIVNLETVPLF